MNIVMFANAFKPVIGGLERSIETFAEDLRAMDNRVLIVTLTFPGAKESDEYTFRLPAIKEVGGTAFSVRVPVPAGLKERLDAFRPQLVHSHHPFMLGDTALRVARRRGLPLVFTHHTLYERYAYLFSRESEMLERIAKSLATEYANLCDLVVAPTRSIELLIRDRGVDAPIGIVPTGVDVDAYSHGDGAAFRRRHGVPEDAFVLGYLGRVVEAKNMDFLGRAVSRFLTREKQAWYLVVGDGECVEPLRSRFARAGVADRVVMTGSLSGPPVADAYAAMDLFAFASQTETQGIVLIEGFCAGVPVVGLDASGTRDTIQDGVNGLLLPADISVERYAGELCRVSRDRELLRRWSRAALERARDFDRRRCARQLFNAYARLVDGTGPALPEEPPLWNSLQERFSAEWNLFKEKLSVMAAAVSGE